MDLKMPSPPDFSRRTPLDITLCRYESGKLVTRPMRVSETRYLTISHVWGNAKWRDIQGFEGKVKATEEKAYFIERKLPNIVGSQYFWMDILCINQKDKAARIAVTQHISTIF